MTNGEAIPFSNGRPNFSKWVKGEVEINVIGDNNKDFGAADKAFAIQQNWLKKNGQPNASDSERYRKSNKLTWHHNEDGMTMQLVPTDLHANIPHEGGASKVRNSQ